MKISELKAALKAKGMSMVGTKTALEERLALAKQCDNPSISELRKLGFIHIFPYFN